MRSAVLVLLISSASFAGDREAATKFVEEGDAARSKGNLAASIEAYDRAVAADPAWPAAWHRRGLARRQAGKLDDAVADFQKAIELDPKAPGPHNDLGLARADQGDLAEAIRCYDTAIELGPDSAIAYNNRSFAKRLSGDVDGALKDATMALQLDPKYARAFLNRGLCLYDLREWEDALADLEKSLSLEPDGQDFTRLRIWILKARLGKREQADKDLREFLGKNQAHADGFDGGAGQLLCRKPGAFAEDLLSQPGIGARAQSEIHFFAGSRLLVDGQKDEAIRHFKEAVGTGVKNTEVIRSAQAELDGLAPPK